ncbi:HAD-IA family hydrolase [Halovulum sp. GXIMD14793]
MTSLILFDVDGTLIDSQELIVSAMTRALQLHDLAIPPRDQILAVVGLSLHEGMAALKPDLNDALYDQLTTTYRDGFIRQRRESGGEALAPFYPGAHQALQRLKSAGHKLGLATGKAMRGVEHTIETHGLHGLFDTIQTADTHPSKPHPSMLLTAMQEVGADPSRTVFIGDTEFDIDMGCAAGVGTVGVGWGYHPQARLAKADRLIASFDALDAAVHELIGGAS